MDKDIHFFFSCIISDSESSREDMKIKRQGKGKTLCPFLRNYNYLNVTSFGPVSSTSQAHLQRVSYHDSNVWDGLQIPAYNLNKLSQNVLSAPQFPAAVERSLCLDSCWSQSLTLASSIRTHTDTSKGRECRGSPGTDRAFGTVWRIMS